MSPFHFFSVLQQKFSKLDTWMNLGQLFGLNVCVLCARFVCVECMEENDTRWLKDVASVPVL